MKKYKSLTIGIIFILVAFGAIYLMVTLQKPEPVQTNEDYGPKGKFMELTEYGDFQCPACAAYYPLVEQLRKEFGDKIKFSYRHFPLDQHKNAIPAAKAYEAAGLQNKYEEMYKTLYEKQGEWANSTDPQTPFEKYASNISLDLEKFKKDVESSEVKDKIEKERKEGLNKSVNSTPTFFINERKMRAPQNYEEFKKAIESVLEI